MALAAYRHLLRAAKIAFEGDTRVLQSAREKIRAGFREQASQPVSESANSIQFAEEVAQVMRSNLVQGKLEGDRYKLNIHKYTERGDNETICQSRNSNGSEAADRVASPLESQKRSGKGEERMPSSPKEIVER